MYIYIYIYVYLYISIYIYIYLYISIYIYLSIYLSLYTSSACRHHTASSGFLRTRYSLTADEDQFLIQVKAHA